MAVKWVGRQRTQAQVNTITPANVNIGNTFTVTIYTVSYTFTATAATVANVTAGLVALLSASTNGMFSELTFTDSTTHVTVTARTPGKPFTQTSTAAGGTATLTTATATANLSPNDANDAVNWDTGVLPTNSDAVYIDNTSVSLLWNLSSLSAVTLASLTIGQSFTGSIGLAATDEDSTPYPQYRPQYFAIGVTTFLQGLGDGDGSPLVKMNFGSVQTTATILNTGSPSDSSLPATILLGTHASNVLNVDGGIVGTAVFGSDVSTWATIRVAAGQSTNAQAPVVTLGTGCTLTTITAQGGTTSLGSAVTTITKQGDATLNIVGSGAITTLSELGGLTNHQGTGTITTLNIGSGGSLDFSGDNRAITSTNTNMYGGSSLNDPGGRVTFSNPIALVRCALADVSLAVGSNRTIGVT